MDAADKVFKKTGELDVNMSLNMMIFCLGFLLGGFTAMLILGLAYLFSHRTSISGLQIADREPIQDVAPSQICPPLTVLSGGKEQTSLKEALSR
jgi:hypothetical protein